MSKTHHDVFWVKATLKVLYVLICQGPKNQLTAGVMGHLNVDVYGLSPPGS